MEHDELSSASDTRHFDCAISWLRLPKTASTSVAQSFIMPLFRAGKFTNTEIGPNTCITGPGGCAKFWQGMRWDDTAILKKIKLDNVNIRNGVVHTPHYVGMNATQTNQRCFPMHGPTAPRLACHEFDARTSTMSFGPHRRNPKPNPNQAKRQPAQREPSKVRAHFDFGPMTSTHVGLDPSLFGWLMPSHPMVFSTFREPIERLLSSFHYGIQFGGGRPGEVDKCDLPGAGKGRGRVERWNERVVKAREIATVENDWTEYQSLLRDYLNTCRMAADNAYVQFLDPYSHNVELAVSNLEKYVIVGLQTDMDGTMARWINITKKSCRAHPQYKDMNGLVFHKILTDMKRNGGFDRRRESTAELKPMRVNTTKRSLGEADEEEHIIEDVPKVDSGIKLIPPDVNNFDEDLQKLISELTAGDSVVFKRVLELYEEQKYLG
jgi:hypothetical protein